MSRTPNDTGKSAIGRCFDYFDEGARGRVRKHFAGPERKGTTCIVECADVPGDVRLLALLPQQRGRSWTLPMSEHSSSGRRTFWTWHLCCNKRILVQRRATRHTRSRRKKRKGIRFPKASNKSTRKKKNSLEDSWNFKRGYNALTRKLSSYHASCARKFAH